MQMSDFITPAFYENPYPVYDQLREAGAFVSLMPGLMVTGRHAVIHRVLRDKRFGRDFLGAIELEHGAEQVKAPVFQSYARMLLFMNPPNHTRLRILLSKAFSAKMETFRSLSDTICHRLIDNFIARGEVDLVREYAMRLPFEIICRLLDISIAATPQLSKAVEDVLIVLDIGAVSDQQLTVSNQAIQMLECYFSDVLAQRRLQPGDDLVSHLIAASEDGDRLSDEEIIANIILLFLAGYETTANMIGNVLIALHGHPTQLKSVLAEPSLVPAAVAECLRFDSSVQTAGRTALEDIEIDGVQIPKGTMVFMFQGAANRDASRYRSPDDLVIGRKDQEAISLGFGGGAHFCLGARLAIIELEVALGALLTRLPSLQLTNLDRLTWRRSSTIRGVEALHARWS